MDIPFERPEVVVELIYCACEQCNLAEKELAGLCERFGAVLSVTRVETLPAAKKLSGWKTPIVFLNGKLVSTFALPLNKWEQAIRDKVSGTEFTITGEVISLDCYLKHEDRGEGHCDCAKRSLQRGEPPGLLTPQGVVFLLLADEEKRRRLAELAARDADIHGPVLRKGGLQSIVVRSIA
jgi:hypothetical protein